LLFDEKKLAEDAKTAAASKPLLPTDAGAKGEDRERGEKRGEGGPMESKRILGRAKRY
jgi:hypothetical protein